MSQIPLVLIGINADRLALRRERFSSLQQAGPLTALSLDLKSPGPILLVTMSRLRATIVALLTLAVAALPAAGASASMMVSTAPQTAMHADCAEHAAATAKADDPADDQSGHHTKSGHHAKSGHHTKSDAVTPNPAKDCADHAACGKCLCLGLAAVLPETSGAQSARLPLPVTAALALSLIGPAYLPPSPPPRL